MLCEDLLFDKGDDGPYTDEESDTKTPYEIMGRRGTHPDYQLSPVSNPSLRGRTKQGPP